MKIIQYNNNKYSCYKTCIDKTSEIIPSEIEHSIISTTDIIPNCSEYRSVSNILRCKLACETPDMIWLDADCILIKWFDFEWQKDKVYFAKSGIGSPLNCAFYVNGRTDFFQDMWNEYQKKMPESIRWFSDFICSRLNDVEFIPDGYLRHLLISRAVMSDESFLIFGITDKFYSLFRNPVTKDITVELKW